MYKFNDGVTWNDVYDDLNKKSKPQDLTEEEIQQRIAEEEAQIDEFERRMFGDGEPEEPEPPVDWEYWAGKYEEFQIDWEAFDRFQEKKKLPLMDSGEVDNFNVPIYLARRVNDIPQDIFVKPSISVVLPPFSPKIAKTIGIPAKNILIKKNIFIKNAMHHSDVTKDSKYILNVALYHPSNVLFDKPDTKPEYRVFVRVDKKYAMATLDFTSSKKYIEVVGWRYANTKTLNQQIERATRNNGRFQFVDYD